MNFMILPHRIERTENTWLFLNENPYRDIYPSMPSRYSLSLEGAPEEHVHILLLAAMKLLATWSQADGEIGSFDSEALFVKERDGDQTYSLHFNFGYRREWYAQMGIENNSAIVTIFCPPEKETFPPTPPKELGTSIYNGLALVDGVLTSAEILYAIHLFTQGEPWMPPCDMGGLVKKNLVHVQTHIFRKSGPPLTKNFISVEKGKDYSLHEAAIQSLHLYDAVTDVGMFPQEELLSFTFLGKGLDLIYPDRVVHCTISESWKSMFVTYTESFKDLQKQHPKLFSDQMGQFDGKHRFTPSPELDMKNQKHVEAVKEMLKLINAANNAPI